MFKYIIDLRTRITYFFPANSANYKDLNEQKQNAGSIQPVKNDFSRMKTLFVISGMFFLIVSCDPYMVYDEYSKTDGGQWKWSDKKTFEAIMKDSIEYYNILINIRHTTDYPKSNLYVFVTTTAPSGATRRDTVEIIVADDRGKWKGNGFSDIKLISREFRKAIRFANPGKYTFQIEQGMRIPEIPVTDVGIRIEEYRELR